MAGRAGHFRFSFFGLVSVDEWPNQAGGEALFLFFFTSF
jgi:hypothetical protein